jgi:hypothetical protein
MEDEYIRPFIPYRLELKPRDAFAMACRVGAARCDRQDFEGVAALFVANKSIPPTTQKASGG